jgi:uncharacterized surface protein with fasciclin (FAS1) repeats
MKASNGLVHAMDHVLVPSFLKNNLVQVAVANSNFKALVTAISAVDKLVAVLKGGSFTIFAPTKAAFAKLGKATINTVLMPPENLTNTLSSMGFDSMVAVAKRLVLLPPFLLVIQLPYSFPLDATFAKLGDISSLSVKTLEEILLYHVVSGRVLSKDLKEGAVLSVQGGNLQVDIAVGTLSASGEKPKIICLNNDAKVICTDKIATNGIIHTIDTVLVLSK